MTIGSRLKHLRILNNWSIADAARQLGLVYTTYRGYEKDEREPGHDFLIKAASVYGVTTDYLLGLSDKGPLDSNLAIVYDAWDSMTEGDKKLIADLARRIKKEELD